MNNDQAHLAGVSKNFKAQLAADSDNGWSSVNMAYYDELADYQPYWQTIPSNTLVNKFRRRFFKILSSD